MQAWAGAVRVVKGCLWVQEDGPGMVRESRTAGEFRWPGGHVNGLYVNGRAVTAVTGHTSGPGVCRPDCWFRHTASGKASRKLKLLLLWSLCLPPCVCGQRAETTSCAGGSTLGAGPGSAQVVLQAGRISPRGSAQQTRSTGNVEQLCRVNRVQVVSEGRTGERSEAGGLFSAKVGREEGEQGGKPS